MKRLLLSLLAALAISLPLFSQEYVGDSCTALLVGKKASSDGSVMTSHTCDPGKSWRTNTGSSSEWASRGA